MGGPPTRAPNLLHHSLLRAAACFVAEPEKKKKASQFQNPPCPAAAAHEPVRGGRRRRRRRRGPGVLGRHREGAAGADAAQGRGVPPRAGLRAAGAGGGRRRAALPVRVRRPPQPPRPLPLHAHPGNAPHTRSSFACSPTPNAARCSGYCRCLHLVVLWRKLFFLCCDWGGGVRMSRIRYNFLDDSVRMSGILELVCWF
jgi:hypothetical protein